jgi:hypothetical protein
MNINECVIVRLTEAGEKAWAKAWLPSHPTGVPDVIRRAATLPDGRVRFQMWQLMHDFGPDCYNGSNRLPFVNNEIEFEMETK